MKHSFRFSWLVILASCLFSFDCCAQQADSSNSPQNSQAGNNGSRPSDNGNQNVKINRDDAEVSADAETVPKTLPVFRNMILRLQDRGKEILKMRAEVLKHASSELTDARCLPELSADIADQWKCEPYDNHWHCDYQEACAYQNQLWPRNVHIEQKTSDDSPVFMCGDNIAKEGAIKCEINKKKRLSHSCLKDKKYIPENTQLKKNKVFCGEYPAPSDDLRPYICEGLSRDNNRWKCGGYACKCGEIIIGHNAECIDGKPACGGLRAKVPLPGFGCFEFYKPDTFYNIDYEEYRCALQDGCDLGNGTICKYAQSLKDGLCVSDYVSDNKEESVCVEGNCPCGDEVCGFNATCTPDGCVCGGEEIDELIDGKYYMVMSSYQKNMAGFTCDSVDCGGTGGDCTQHYYKCDNLNGCTLNGFHYSIGEPVNDEEYIRNDYNIGCGFHIDGDKDITEYTKCDAGDCVVPLKDGHCGADTDNPDAVRWIHYGSAIEQVYDNEMCTGGTRYCHGRKHEPIPQPQSEKGYICGNVTKHTYNDYKVWICADERGCLCGNSYCGPNMACVREQCLQREDLQIEDITGETKPEETGHVADKTNESSGTSAVNRDYYNEEYGYLNSFYTQDPSKFKYCGPNGMKMNASDKALEIQQKTSEQDAFLAAYHIDRPEPDLCLVRKKCTPDNFMNPEQYVCDHGLSVFKMPDGKVVVHDRPLGLRCNAAEGCACGNEVCPIFEFCENGNRCKNDSLYERFTCHIDDGNSPDDLYRFWNNYEQFESINAGYKKNNHYYFDIKRTKCIKASPYIKYKGIIDYDCQYAYYK